MEAMNQFVAPGLEGLLSPLNPFLKDPAISEILINRPQEIFIEKEGEMSFVEIPILTAAYLRRLSTFIANENKQILSEEYPILSGALNDGTRVQIVLPPASQHAAFSFRKFSLKNMSLLDYERTGFFSQALPSNKIQSEGSSKIKMLGEERLETLYAQGLWQGFLRQAIIAKKNILIAGATSSGKTTFLNACLQEIPASERLIILEDTYEVKVAHRNTLRLKALKPLEHQKLSLNMQDLVQASLRLRPDRIIMGEIRGKEVLDFISACYTGHNGALATIHASSPALALVRMVQLYKLNAVPSMTEKELYQLIEGVIDVILQLKKTPQGRRLVEIYYKGTSAA